MKTIYDKMNLKFKSHQYDDFIQKYDDVFEAIDSDQDNIKMVLQQSADQVKNINDDAKNNDAGLKW